MLWDESGLRVGLVGAGGGNLRIQGDLSCAHPSDRLLNKLANRHIVQNLNNMLKRVCPREILNHRPEHSSYQRLDSSQPLGCRVHTRA